MSSAETETLDSCHRNRNYLPPVCSALLTLMAGLYGRVGVPPLNAGRQSSSLPSFNDLLVKFHFVKIMLLIDWNNRNGIFITTNHICVIPSCVGECLSHGPATPKSTLSTWMSWGRCVTKGEWEQIDIWSVSDIMNLVRPLWSFNPYLALCSVTKHLYKLSWCKCVLCTFPLH